MENIFPEVAGKLSVGRPKELITMTIKTFKKFCMKARTDKADEIHNQDDLGICSLLKPSPWLLLK